MRTLAVAALLCACSPADAPSSAKRTGDSAPTTISSVTTSDDARPTDHTSTDTPATTTTPPSEATVIEEGVVLGAADLLDILFVVDNSCSMGATQDRLAATAPAIAPSLSAVDDFHVGVITADMVNSWYSGRLQRIGSQLWIDETCSDLPRALEDVFQQGIWGDFQERGLDAAMAAIDVLGATRHAGFVRPGSSLHIVILSDEDDDSAVGWTAFADWLDALRLEHPVVEFHSIVLFEATPENPPEARPGEQYLQTTDAVGGESVDLNSATFDLDMQGLTDAITDGRVHCPAEEPMLDTVEFTDADGLVVSDEGWWLHEFTGCFVFEEGSQELTLRYKTL